MLRRMTHGICCPRANQSGPALIMLALLILVVYGNSFSAGWHLDDYQNILQNPKSISTVSTLIPCCRRWNTLGKNNSGAPWPI